LRGDGIWLFNAARATVRDCVLDTVRDGIYVSFGHDQLLVGNQILNSRYAVHDMYAQDLTIEANTLRGNLSGLVMMYGGPVAVTGNTITDSGSASTGFGAIVKDVGGVTLRANVLADNRIGLDVDDAGRTVGEATLVDGNTIALNQVGVLLAPSADATFTGNAFIENTTQVVLNGTGVAQTTWTSGDVGNYWSDYGGFDAEGDGTGDLPYVRSGRTGQLIAANPLLLALASGPAFRLLMSVEDRWAPTTPTVDDPFPQTQLSSPRMASASAAPLLPLWIPGLLMIMVGLWLLRGARRVQVIAHG
jgi:nitrous oxidase accessory protein